MERKNKIKRVMRCNLVSKESGGRVMGILATADTGAGRIVVNHKVMENLKITENMLNKDHNISLVDASNNKLNILGSTTLKIVIENVNVAHTEAFVVKETGYKMLASLRFMKDLKLLDEEWPKEKKKCNTVKILAAEEEKCECISRENVPLKEKYREANEDRNILDKEKIKKLFRTSVLNKCSHQKLNRMKGEENEMNLFIREDAKPQQVKGIRHIP